MLKIQVCIFPNFIENHIFWFGGCSSKGLIFSPPPTVTRAARAYTLHQPPRVTWLKTNWTPHQWTPG